VLKSREASLESRIEKLKAQLVGGDEIAPLVDVLRTVEAERLKVVDELAVAQREAASPTVTALGDTKSLVDMLDAADDPNEVRTRLRGALRRAVESVRCLFLTHKQDRLAFVTVAFSGGKQRMYALWHTPPKANAAKRAPGRWWARSVVANEFRVGGKMLEPGFVLPDGFAERFRAFATGRDAEWMCAACGWSMTPATDARFSGERPGVIADGKCPRCESPVTRQPLAGVTSGTV
jgi:hypothetical protein